MKNSKDNIGNSTRNLPACSAVPQPTAPPRASHIQVVTIFMNRSLSSHRLLLRTPLLFPLSTSFWAINNFRCASFSYSVQLLPSHACYRTVTATFQKGISLTRNSNEETEVNTQLPISCYQISVNRVADD
jgi:hypothetical protein